MAVSIKSRPSISVSNLVLKRRGSGDRHIDATWKVPGDLTNQNKSDRATQLIATWWIGISGTDPGDKRTYGTNVKTSNMNIANFKSGSRSFNRASFWPLTDKKMDYVSFRVQPRNGKGMGRKYTHLAYWFKVPRRPTIEPIVFDAQSGEVSTVVNTNPGNDEAERYDTEYYWTVEDTREETPPVDVHTANTSTAISLSYDATGWQAMSYDDYLKATCRARARGLKGDSAWAERSYYVSYPAEPVITSTHASSRGSTGKVTVGVQTNASTEHPVDVVRLEALQSVPYATPEAIPSTVMWDNTGAVDDGQCTALSVSVADVEPDPGLYTWVRLMSWHIDERLYRYSAPVRLTDLEVPAETAGSDAAVILSCLSSDDGKGAVVHIAWGAGGTDNSTGTELSWDTDPNAWRSTDDPQAYEFAWSDGPITVDDVQYAGSATVTIKGLTDGEAWYVRARRYLEGDVVSYGAYSDIKSVIPSVAPDGVSVDVPAYVAAGEGLTVTWTYGGGGTQRGWQVIVGGQPVESGDDAMGSCTMDAQRVASLATDDQLTIAVAVSTGGVWAQSDPATVTIVQPPTLTLTVPATVTAQPLTFAAASSVSAILLVSVAASGSGVSGQTPAGIETQPAGDVVWSGAIAPAWSNGACSVTLPEGLALMDGGEYALSVTALDPSTGLTSGTEAATVGVAWAHQAPDPDGFATVTATDSVDADGVHHQSATVTLTSPTGAAAGDSYELYRMTADGATLIGSYLPLSCEVTDEYAPFGDGMDLAYRVACRTADGDVAWTDVAYELAGSAIRVDWDGGSVELPYNIAISDGYSKDVEVHEYLDGSTDAFYNEGTRRTAKLSTDVIRLDDQGTVAAVRALARYDGPAYVRTPDGSAYEADVQVSDMSTEGPIVAVALDATQVRETAAFLLPPMAEENEDEEGDG